MLCLKHFVLSRLFTRKKNAQINRRCCYLKMNVYSKLFSRDPSVCSAGVYVCKQNRSYHLLIYINNERERERDRGGVHDIQRRKEREKTSSHHVIVLFVYYFEIIYLLAMRRAQSKFVFISFSLSSGYI